MIQTLNGNSNPQRSFGVQLSTVPIYTPTGMLAVVTQPIQIVGLVPLLCASSTPDARLPLFRDCDCRDWTNDECYINPVFASTSSTDVLKNDHNMFLMEYPFYFQYQWGGSLAQMSLAKYDGVDWNFQSYLSGNTYGTYYDFDDLCIPNWTGFDIDWRKVLLGFGEGIYRFQVAYSIFGNGGTLYSEPFCLKEWSCAGTDVTVRWETTISGGQIGSITDDKRMFDFCCADSNGRKRQVTWYDQIRVYAFFGREKTEYERVNIEYGNGEVIQVRNEAIQKFEYESALQPKWVHDRLKAYAFMADELYVTDYNWNNSDYEILKKRVSADGSYEPEYHEDTRYSFVKVQFKEGFQNVIRDKCCSTPIQSP